MKVESGLVDVLAWCMNFVCDRRGSTRTTPTHHSGASESPTQMAAAERSAETLSTALSDRLNEELAQSN